MGAIAGIVDLDVAECDVERMRGSMARRTSGETGVHLGKGACLLCFNDSPQQMWMHECFWEGEQYVICFDGWINNQRELQEKLRMRGHLVASNDVAELLLHGYICWKEALLEQISGAFSLAILSERERKLFLARDHLGIKPLFYTLKDRGIVFGSEMKYILSLPGTDACLDATGIAQVMLLGPGRIPGSGVFRDLQEIEPGCYGIFQGGNLQLRRYWKLQDRVHTDSFEETVEKVRHMVIASTRQQLYGRQAAGTMLSGGLDSSIVSAICAREYAHGGRKLHTFSLDYENSAIHFQPGRFQPDLDTDYIRIMVENIDSNHHWSVLSSEDLLCRLHDAMVARDLPGMVDVDASLLAFAAQIRPHTAVVLSGECADELFGGYPWYCDPEMRDFPGFPWSRIWQERADFVQDWVFREFAPEEFIQEHYQRTIDQSDILPENSPTERRVKELYNLNLRWFMQTLLERGDRMGKLCDLEIRVPFCDYQLAEYLYAVPWCYKFYKGQEKGLLRKSMEGLLPQTVLFRKKSPFPKTYDPYYLATVSQQLRQLLNDPSAPIFMFVKKEALEHLLEQDFPWPWYGQLMRRPQVIGYMLQMNAWLKHYSVKILN